MDYSLTKAGRDLCSLVFLSSNLKSFLRGRNMFDDVFMVRVRYWIHLNRKTLLDLGFSSIEPKLQLHLLNRYLPFHLFHQLLQLIENGVLMMSYSY